MAVNTRDISHEGPGGPFHGRFAWDDAATGPRPAVLIVPSFMNRTAFEDDKAEKLAAMGYAAFAMDIYGQHRQPGGMDEAWTLMSAVNNDRRLLAERITTAWDRMRAEPEADAARTAAIGYCFGGKCVLDLARSGADVAGVVAFHGLFDPPPFETAPRIGAKVLALHGWDDDLAKPEAVVAFAQEMTDKGADWQLHAYGHTVHAFTNYNRPDMYRADADHRSWQAMTNFLVELFG